MLVFALLATFTKGPYLQHVTKGEISILWQTNTATQGRVVARPEGGLGEAVSGTSPTGDFHRIRLVGLKASTTYQYTVSAGQAVAHGTFQTAPATPDEPFTFIVLGDTRSSYGDADGGCGGSRPRIRDLILGEAPDFVLHTGDLVRGGNEAHYADFFACYRALLKHVVFFPTVGNHEYFPRDSSAPIQHFVHYFRYPRTEARQTWYAFTYGNSRFIQFDADPVVHAPVRWLDEEIAAAEKDPAIEHIFISFHAPPYTSGYGPGGFAAPRTISREHIETHAASGKIRAVFTGHIHDYEHLRKKGIDFVVSGGGGADLWRKRWDNSARQFSLAFSGRHHYVRVKVTGGSVSFAAVDLDGTVLDSFTSDRAIAQVGANVRTEELAALTTDPNGPEEPGLDEEITLASGCSMAAGGKNGNEAAAGILVVFAAGLLIRRARPGRRRTP
jgi:acid phosphatase type 7